MITRIRLVAAASELFAERGYAGASVRDICNLARANPGAVSYHFGGKRQLYRSVLRTAAESLSSVSIPAPDDETEADPAVHIIEVLRGVFRSLDDDPVATRLLLRDLADGGSLAAEALEPRIRAVLEGLQSRFGGTDVPRTTSETGMLFLQLAAPLFLAAIAWPAVARPLDLREEDRERILVELTRRVLERL